MRDEKAKNNAQIPYKFAIVKKYPQYVILAYIPKKDVVREFIKVKRQGYQFHEKFFHPFFELVNWFKKSMREREYQRYVSKIVSP